MGVDITSITDTNGDALNAPPPASSPDPGFSRLLDSATGQKPSIEESPKTAEMGEIQPPQPTERAVPSAGQRRGNPFFAHIPEQRIFVVNHPLPEILRNTSAEFAEIPPKIPGFSRNSQNTASRFSLP